MKRITDSFVAEIDKREYKVYIYEIPSRKSFQLHLIPEDPAITISWFLFTDLKGNVERDKVCNTFPVKYPVSFKCGMNEEKIRDIERAMALYLMQSGL